MFRQLINNHLLSLDFNFKLLFPGRQLTAFKHICIINHPKVPWHHLEYCPLLFLLKHGDSESSFHPQSPHLPCTAAFGCPCTSGGLMFYLQAFMLNVGEVPLLTYLIHAIPLGYYKSPSGQK